MQPKHGQHPAGFSFLGAVGVVATQITGGARAGVVDLPNAERATLPDDFGGKIDFIMRRPNAGAQLDDYVRGIGAEVFNHLSDCVCNNAELSAFPSRMHKANRRRFWIHDVNCATVGDVDPEGDAAPIRDKPIARGEFAARDGRRSAASAVGAERRPYLIDYSDVVSVNLFGGEQRPIAKAGCLSNFAMRRIESLQHFGFIVRDVDAGNSLHENVTTDFNRAQRRKLFERQMHLCASL
jgi:hypothetical protein